MSKPTIVDEHGEREMTDAEYEQYLLITAIPDPELGLENDDQQAQ